MTLQDSALPNGWTVAPLGHLCLINPRSFVEAVGDDDEVSFVPMAAVEAATGNLDSSMSRPYKEVSKGYTRFSEGDVLFAKITPCMENGKIAAAKGLKNRAGCGSTEFHVMRPIEGLNDSLLLFFLLQEAIRKEAQGNMTGSAGQLRVPAAFLEETSFPLPPLPEQHRIVAEIEKQLTRLDASVGALRRAKANLKRYRASVLKDACEGRLVPTEASLARAEGREYEHAGQLLQRILEERRARWESQEKRRGTYKEPAPPDTSALRELPEGWVWATVDALMDIIRGLAFPKEARQAEPTEDSIACLRTANVQDSVEWDDLWHIPEYFVRSSRQLVQESDVLMSVSNSLELLGKVAQVKNVPTKSTFGAFVALLRAVDTRNQDFLYWQLVAPEARSVIRRAGSTTTNISNISSSRLAEVPIRLPPLSEQHRIVAEVERRLSVVQQAEATVDASLRRAERLRQSVLKRAFEGKLVPQDPNDEPASALLERIRAEREAAQASASRNGAPYFSMALKTTKGGHDDQATDSNY